MAVQWHLEQACPCKILNLSSSIPQEFSLQAVSSPKAAVEREEFCATVKESHSWLVMRQQPRTWPLVMS